MPEAGECLSDAIATRLWECLPKLLEDLPDEVVSGQVTEALVLDLARRLGDAVTKPIP
jgi:hypothetical protein